MPRDELSGPDLDGVVADANAVGLPYVVIGGFSVIAHGYLRATKDSDLLVPDGPEADEAIHRFLERIEATRLADGKELKPADGSDPSTHFAIPGIGCKARHLRGKRCSAPLSLGNLSCCPSQCAAARAMTNTIIPALNPQQSQKNTRIGRS